MGMSASVRGLSFGVKDDGDQTLRTVALDEFVRNVGSEHLSSKSDECKHSSRA
jgi:hypothetical protein